MYYSIKLLLSILSMVTLCSCEDKKTDATSTDISRAKEKQDAKT